MKRQRPGPGRSGVELCHRLEFFRPLFWCEFYNGDDFCDFFDRG